MLHQKKIAVALLCLVLSAAIINPVDSQLETVLATLAAQVGVALATKIITLVGEQVVKYAEFQITQGTVCGVGNALCACRDSHLTIANHNLEGNLQGPSMRYATALTKKTFGNFCKEVPGTIQPGDNAVIHVGNSEGTIGTGAEINFAYIVLDDAGKNTACMLKGFIENSYLDDYNPFDASNKDPWVDYKLNLTPECATLFPGLTVEKVAATSGTKGTGAYYMVYMDGKSAPAKEDTPSIIASPSPAPSSPSPSPSPVEKSPSPVEKSPVVAQGPATSEAAAAFGDDFSSVAAETAAPFMSPPPVSSAASSQYKLGSFAFIVAACVVLALLH
jgi:hypothetical protein